MYAEGLSVRGSQQENGSNDDSRGKSSSTDRGGSKFRNMKSCKKNSHDISECWKL